MDPLAPTIFLCIFEVRKTKNLAEAQQAMLLQNKASNLQEWHGLTMGLKWIQHDDENDPYRRQVKDRLLHMKKFDWGILEHGYQACW